MHWEMVDIRDEIDAFEREIQRWPRSGSVSKPWPRDVGFPPWEMRWSNLDMEIARHEKEREDYYRWHHVKLIFDDGDSFMPIRNL